MLVYEASRKEAAHHVVRKKAFVRWIGNAAIQHIFKTFSSFFVLAIGIRHEIKERGLGRAGEVLLHVDVVHFLVDG